MSFSRHACHRTAVRFQQQQRPNAHAHAQFGPAIDHVWISDEYLAAVFTRFFACPAHAHGQVQQRRHGSSVPGPLEARRRLNKRRNMNLASVRAGMMGIDPAVLFGAGTGNASSVYGGAAEVRPPLRPTELDARVFDFNSRAPPAPTISAPPPPPPPPPLTPGKASKSASKVDKGEAFLAKLGEASTVDQIRKIAKDFYVRPGKQTDWSLACFKHVLRMHPADPRLWMEDVEGFLLDRVLNSPKAGNFARLVRFLGVRELETEQVDWSIGFVRRMVSAGIMQYDQLNTIVRLIPNIRADGTTLRESDPERLGQYIMTLWETAAATPGLLPNELRPNSWLDALFTAKATGRVLSVAKELLTRRRHEPVSWHYGTRYILQVLDLAAENGHVPSEITNIDDGAPLPYLEEIDFVAGLHGPEQFAHCIPQVTEVLTFAPRYEATRIECLTIWTWMMQRLSNAPGLLLQKRALRDLTYKKFSEEYSLTMPKDDRRVLRLWMVTVLGFHTAQSNASHFHRRETFQVLLNGLRNDDMVTRLFDVLQELKDRGVPLTRPVVMAAVRSEYSRAVSNKPGDTMIPEFIDRLVSLVGPGRLPVEKLFSQFQGHRRSLPGPQYGPHPMFHNMVQAIDITSPAFLEEVIQHVETPSPRRSILLNILRNHIGAKIALGLSHQPTTTGVTVRRCDLDTQVIKPFQTPADPDTDNTTPTRTSSGRSTPSPTSALETFNSLALIFAFSPGLSPRASWKLTYWCYRFMAKHNAPIKPILVRALYYAGVVRFREERRVLWGMEEFVIGLVRKVEGREAAARARRRMGS